MLLLKLFLIPFFIALISIAGRYWGARIAGSITVILFYSVLSVAEWLFGFGLALG